MARTIYEDEVITEYADGTETVRFSDAEWEVMLADPAFGYVHPCGHPTSAAERRAMETGMGDTHCHACEADAEAIYGALMDAEEVHGPCTHRTLASGRVAIVAADGRVVEILR